MELWKKFFLPIFVAIVVGLGEVVDAMLTNPSAIHHHHHLTKSHATLSLLHWGPELGAGKVVTLTDYYPEASVVVYIVGGGNETLDKIKDNVGHLIDGDKIKYDHDHGNVHFDPIMKPFQSKIIVHAPKGYGIMAVVQGLHLRVHNFTRQCVDYIMFHEIDSNNRGPQSDPVCGHMKTLRRERDGGITTDHKTFRGPRMFTTTSGELELNLRSEKQYPEQTLYSSPREPLLASISFTAYRPCGKVSDLDLPHQFHCGHNKNCISMRSRCDGVLNCGTLESFTADEVNCEELIAQEYHHDELPYLFVFYGGLILFLIFLGVVALGYKQQRRIVKRMRNIPH